MKLTKVTLYRNTPYTDFMNTVDFGSNNARDDFFNSHYDQFTYNSSFNFIRDRLTLKVSCEGSKNWDWLNSVNYVSFISEFDGIRYYAQALECKYLNDNNVQFNLVIDGLMTFCQGGISQYAKNVQIDRQHLTNKTFSDNLQYLRTNNDILEFNNLNYIHQDLFKMIDLRVIFRSSVDLASDFGDSDNPKMKTSAGQVYDYIVSPQNIYTCEYADFPKLMDTLKDYPWITQNFTSVIIVPKKLFDDSDLEDAKISKGGFDKLKKFKDGHYSANVGEVKELSHSPEDLFNLFGLDEKHPEVLRNSYTNIELNNYQGSQIQLDPAFLNNGVKIMGQVIIGYDNQIAFFQSGYRSSGENHVDGLNTGSYLNNAIIFKDFDSVPILIDQYKLSYAQSAHQRDLAENNLLTGQVGNILNPKENLQDRMMSAVNLSSNLSPTAIGGKLVDEWQFYRTQQAQLADKKISSPTVTEMSTNNSFAIKQGFFGITAKYSTLPNSELHQIYKYHAQFGYDWQRVDDLEPTFSMNYLNYAKFKGNWIIDDRNVPQSVMEQIRVQFENGVKIWHNPDNLENPFKQDITDLNIRVM